MYLLVSRFPYPLHIVAAVRYLSITRFASFSNNCTRLRRRKISAPQDARGWIPDDGLLSEKVLSYNPS